MKQSLLILPFIVFGIFACSDEENSETMQQPVVIDAPDTQEESNNVLSGDSVRVWVNESFVLGVFGDLDCRNDDAITFFENGTYEYDGGSSLCGDSDNQQIVTGTWEIDLDNNQILFDKGQESEAVANYITLRDDLIQVQGSWNSIGIDARYIRQ